MKTYLSSKIKKAAKISDIKRYTDVARLFFADGLDIACVDVDLSYMDKHKPQIGGYFVQYTDGYRSFEPAESFENQHVELSGGLTFGQAFEALQHGKEIARTGWNGKGQFVYQIKAADLQSGLKYGFGEYEGEPTFAPVMCLHNAQKQLVVGWIPSTGDLYATDWQVRQ